MSRLPALGAEFGLLLVELLVLLFGISMLLAITVRRTGLARVQRWLGGGRVAGTLKGMGLGFVIPFCTYSAIPAFVGLVDVQVRTATVAGFLLAAPLLDPLVLGVLVLLFGWQVTVTYALATAATVFGVAMVADALRVERHLRPVRARVAVGAATIESSISASCDPYRDERGWRGLRPEMRSAAHYAVGLVRGLAVPMVLAVAVAAAIVGYVPAEALAAVAGPDNPLAVPAAAAIGAPFYVSTEAFLPIASAFHGQGMALGAVFALTISAAGVNLPELTLLSRLMARRLLAAYVAAVVGVAVSAGSLMPLLVR